MKVNPDIVIDVFDGVYSPSDDTHLLLSSIENVRSMKVLELGTGTGIIALHCAKEGALVTATDISSKAILNAHYNAQANDVFFNIIRTDLFRGLEGAFDLIVFNPPYLSGEEADKLEAVDRQQLIGGRLGYELTRRFLDDADRFLAPGGHILLLVSSETAEGVLDYADEGYVIEKVRGKRVFFEELAIYRFTARSR